MKRACHTAACLAALVSIATPVSASEATDRAAISEILQASAAAWSNGDLASFMQSYEDSPTTTFVTGLDLLRGYKAIQDHYAAHYGKAAPHSMGHLSFKMLDERPLSQDYALVAGLYALARPKSEGGDAKGIFTLVFHHTKAGWRIASDHTS